MWEGAGLEGVEVRTVDGFQGREKELIILRYSKYLGAHKLKAHSISISTVHRETMDIGREEVTHHYFEMNSKTKSFPSFFHCSLVRSNELGDVGFLSETR